MIKELYQDAVWLHGGAVGFDRQVKNYASKNNIPQEEYLPDYSKYKKAAPLRRNDEMIEACDLIVVCYDGRKSGGTYYTINKAMKKNKKIIYIASS